MTGQVARDKRALRERMRELLASMSGEEAALASARVCAALEATDLLAEARTVLAYAAIPGELDLAKWLAGCLGRGVRVCLPAIDWERRTLEPALVESLDRVAAVRHGVPEPLAGSPRVGLGELDAIVVPGLAFDSAGGRLGRGAGFYDRLLGRLQDECGNNRGRNGGQPVVIGACFDAQVCDTVPREPHDRLMDAIASESGVRLCAGGDGPRSGGIPASE